MPKTELACVEMVRNMMTGPFQSMAAAEAERVRIAAKYGLTLSELLAIPGHEEGCANYLFRAELEGVSNCNVVWIEGKP